ncbi:caspase family protein [Bradyrhizobium sp. AZCC 2230]|uniref:caspase family protein n=1 Tax=Bradyrhizobium sp. AZCC 2230 TaxID=3117021 RepID=UPI002FF2AF36
MRITTTALFLVLLFCLQQPASAESRVALVVGNGSYERVPELPNPPHDAADIGHALERLGFKVTQIKNANAQDMRKAVIDFGRVAEGADMAVVFYAGHGMEVGGENWLIPVDAELRSDADIESEAVSLRSISAQASKAKQLGLIILDACRNNPFAAKMKRSIGTRALARGLAPTEPSDNVLIAYAARDGTTASDGDGRNSPFTGALLRHVETPGLEISFLFRRVRDDVMMATKREQQPFVYGSLSKEEIYLKAPAVNAAITAKPVPTPPSDEEKLWEETQASTERGRYQDFLSKYPSSKHAAQARSRINDLVVKEVATPPATTIPSENQSSATKPLDRNVFTAEDSKKIATTMAAQDLKIPDYSFQSTSDSPLTANSKFVGVWSNKRGWGDDGTGRYGMLIVTEVSATGLARGYYLWGPPGKRSWTKDGAGYKSFSDYIVNDKLSIGGTEVSAKYDHTNVLKLSSFRKDKPSETSSIVLRPIWQLVRVRFDTEPNAKREQAVRDSSPNKGESAKRYPEVGALGSPEPPTEGGSCSRMKDVMGCNCALKTGGYIYPNPRSNNHTGYSFRWTNSSAYSTCLHAAGRR